MDDEPEMLGGRIAGHCFVAVHGRATALQCTSLRQFVLDALSAETNCICIDLRHCTYGDSTFLGTLLQFRKACDPPRAARLVLSSPTPELIATLRSMGLLRLFTIEDAPLPDGIAWRPLPRESPGRCSFEFRENVALAHRLLADSSETCRLRYEAIADAAEQELARQSLT